MLIKDLLQKLQSIENKQEQLKQEKKNLIIKAKDEHILEVNLSDFTKCLSEILNINDSNFETRPIYVPSILHGDIEQAKEYITKNNMGIGIKIFAHGTYVLRYPICDIKLENGQNLIDNLKFSKNESTMFAPKEIEEQIMLNFSLNDDYMKKPAFKEAVLICAEKRETSQLLRRLQW